MSRFFPCRFCGESLDAESERPHECPLPSLNPAPPQPSATSQAAGELEKKYALWQNATKDQETDRHDAFIAGAESERAATVELLKEAREAIAALSLTQKQEGLGLLGEIMAPPLVAKIDAFLGEKGKGSE